MTRWPAFIKFLGDDELYFTPSQSAWEQDQQIHTAQFRPEDRLVDADGKCYHLQQDSAGQLQVRPSGEQLSLQEVLQLVRLHAAQDGACCVAKLSADSIAAAIAMLE